MKKRGIVVAALMLFFLFCSRITDAGTFKAVSSVQPVLLDGTKVSISAYLIEGNNYFKLRDVAAILKDTGSRFGVSYDSETKSIGIRTGADYKVGEQDLKPLFAEPQDAVLSSQSVLIDGRKVALKAYFIRGNNYFMLRELGEQLNFEVDYHAPSKSVLITSKNIGSEHMAARIRIEHFPKEGLQIRTYLYDVHITVGPDKEATLNYDPMNKKLIALLQDGKNLPLGNLSVYVQQNGKRQELNIDASGVLSETEMAAKQIDLNQSYSIVFVVKNTLDGKLIPWVILEH